MEMLLQTLCHCDIPGMVYKDRLRVILLKDCL